MATKTKRSKRNHLPAPKPRDIEIYERCLVDRIPQRAVGAEFGISQAAVSKIVTRLRRWNSQVQLVTNRATEHAAEPARVRRLYALSRLHKRRLDWGHRQMCEKWRASQDHILTVKRRTNAKGEILEERMSRSTPGNPRFVADAIKYSEKLCRFEGLSLDGEVDLSGKNRLYEEPEWTHDEAMVELRKQIDGALPQLEKWEAEQEELLMGNCGLGIKGKGEVKAERGFEESSSASCEPAWASPGSEGREESPAMCREEALSGRENGYQPVITETMKNAEKLSPETCEVVTAIEDSDDVIVAEVVEEKVIKTEELEIADVRLQMGEKGEDEAREKGGLRSRECKPASPSRVSRSPWPGTLVQHRSATANEPRGREGSGRREGSTLRVDPGSTSAAQPHFPAASTPAVSKISKDSRGRLLFEADGYKRPIPLNWIEPPRGKFPEQWVEEGY